MIFHLVQNFAGTLSDYRECVKSAIEKAMLYDIEIMGLVTDNLPIQIQAFSQDSDDCFQKAFKDDYLHKIIHFRCCSYLLSLAFRDWMKYECALTEY